MINIICFSNFNFIMEFFIYLKFLVNFYFINKDFKFNFIIISFNILHLNIFCLKFKYVLKFKFSYEFLDFF
jgi:hypothetical protein